ncbi:hypothetical protein ACFSM5_03050 [Lacibacterium aquatile]|uniref:Uncharacterized protein n=1 Tax=Lacibacterium aquatile TaxID=1168082 RepID=A0ABW5DMZ7_9PROT
MSYLAQKLREAIQASKGDRNAAARRLMAMASEDLNLLRAITTPYLQGIAFALVEKAMGKQPSTMQVAPNGAVQRPGPTAAPVRRPGGPAGALPKETLDAIVDKLDRNMPAPPKPPAKSPSTPAEALANLGIDPKGPPPTKAGQQHKAAMVEMAKAFKKF